MLFTLFYLLFATYLPFLLDFGQWVSCRLYVTGAPTAAGARLEKEPSSFTGNHLQLQTLDLNHSMLNIPIKYDIDKHLPAIPSKDLHQKLSCENFLLLLIFSNSGPAKSSLRAEAAVVQFNDSSF